MEPYGPVWTPAWCLLWSPKPLLERVNPSTRWARIYPVNNIPFTVVTKIQLRLVPGLTTLEQHRVTGDLLLAFKVIINLFFRFF